eukprot:s2025_g15.t3
MLRRREARGERNNGARLAEQHAVHEPDGVLLGLPEGEAEVAEDGNSEEGLQSGYPGGADEWEEIFACPLSIRFTQDKIHPFFYRRGPIVNVLPKIRAVPAVSEGDEEVLDLLPPFAPIHCLQKVYTALAEADCIPRRWHPEGREGLSIQAVPEQPAKRLLPLLEGSQDRLPGLVSALLSEGRAELVRKTTKWRSGPGGSRRPVKDLQSIPFLSPEALQSGCGGSGFRFAELFAGIGGFRLGLESLGGRCVFASEIEPFTREVYTLNFGTRPEVLGDIQMIQDEEIPPHDMLVAGFPCQPFSGLGEQPGLEDPKGRGLLFREVCRVLRARQCPLFLLENVPGLAETDEGKALKAIKEELTACNYDVVLRTLNAKAFTAQSRKRIFFIGFRQDLGLAKPAIEIPDFPDLNLRARDIFEPEEELNASLLQAYTLSEEHFRKLQGCKKWSRRGGMTDTFAWGDKVCSTLVGHYGTSISRGNSQLVPRPAPHLPRRFSPRECARLMGFPDSFKLTEYSESSGQPAVWFRRLYKMFGNSVCPPLVATLASAMLDHASWGKEGATRWSQLGRSAALNLALSSVAPGPRQEIQKALHASWHSWQALHTEAHAEDHTEDG